jgi:hypothetical protein
MEDLSPYKMMNHFVQSSPIDKYIQKKNGFDYLPWSIAYHYVKAVFPKAKVIKHTFRCDTDNETIAPYMRDAQGHAWVQCSILWEGFETSEIFPITDFRNQPIKNPTSKDVDNALQRCMTKCIAMFCGVGLQLWHGEDLPVSFDPDSSGGKDGIGEGVGNISNDKNAKISENNSPIGSKSAPSIPNNFKNVGLTLDEQIKMVPDRKSLDNLYLANKKDLSMEQLAAFEAKAKEFKK